jgi:LysM repeat protein
MKKQVLVLLQCLILTVGFSQPAKLLIKNGAKGFYLEHTVAAKEGLFPLGRLYNVHPRHIAAFNNHDFNKGLSIGQLINIPLTDTNFSQMINKGVPVYYTAKEKESLVNISKKFRNVQVNDLRAWNNLSSNNVAAGANLIIGFLITNEMQDRVIIIAEKKKENPPPPVEEKKEPVQEVKKEEPKKVEPEIKKEEPPLVKEQPKKISPVVVATEEKSTGTEDGFFRDYFNQQIKQSPISKEQTLTSAVFKSINGWQDAKYYLLINGVEPGTIVKITNPANNKMVYAKVLYGMEGIRQNQGFDMRISDAAAAALGITETDKFIVKVSY